MVREMKKAEAGRYLEQAEEFLATAVESHESERYNAATFSAIQAMMNANDALTIHFLGQRASSDHREALKLHGDVARLISDSSQRTRLANALGQRADAGYGGDIMLEADAEKAIKAASRFMEWVHLNTGL
ncbi:MAG: HEPN domain-containing protein [Thermoplasmata archaeon]